MMARLCMRAGIGLRIRSICQSGNPKFGTTKILLKEGYAMASGTVKWFNERKGYGIIE